MMLIQDPWLRTLLQSVRGKYGPVKYGPVAQLG